MKTYLQINESKSTLKASLVPHTLTHVQHTHALTHLCLHTPSYTVFFHAVHNTEGILRGLCNREHTKQFQIWLWDEHWHSHAQ